MDTPVREIQLWEGGEGLSELFEDIEKLILECRFSDCKHESEPGCAINAAIKKGKLDAGRLKSYKKLLGEVSYFERRHDKKAQIVEKKKWKKLTSEGKKRDKRNI
jgi:ribosome biogenesis GTPase